MAAKRGGRRLLRLRRNTVFRVALFGQGLAIAAPRGQADLKRAINAALETLHDKGVYAELYLRYFPVSFF